MWHGDGVRVYKQQKCWIYSFSSALRKGPSLQSKLLFLVVREACTWKPFTHDCIGAIVGWVQRALQSGRYPEFDFNGQQWPARSRERALAGQQFANGWKLAFSAWKGDWEAKVYIHKLAMSYNHNALCEHCPASKLDVDGFFYKDFSPRAGYMSLQYTHAQFMLLTPVSQQSSWTCVPGWTKDRNLEEPCMARKSPVICLSALQELLTFACFRLNCYALSKATKVGRSLCISL